MLTYFDLLEQYNIHLVFCQERLEHKKSAAMSGAFYVNVV